MPEKEGYFRIVETRGLIWIILAKFCFYVLLLLGILKFIFGYFSTMPENMIMKTLGNNRTPPSRGMNVRKYIVYSLKFLLFIVMFFICLFNIFSSSSNKTTFFSTGIKLQTLNKETLDQITEASVHFL